MPGGPGVGVDDGSVRGVGDVSAAVAAASTGPSREAWTPSAEQEHNLQLLELVVKLREAMLGIPSFFVPKGEKLAVGVAAGSGGGSFEAACRDQITEAVNALDEIASGVILEPYLSRVALSLEEVIAKMHRFPTQPVPCFGFLHTDAQVSPPPLAPVLISPYLCALHCTGLYMHTFVLISLPTREARRPI